MKRTKLFKKFCALVLTAVTLMTFCSSGGTAVLAEDYEEGFYYSDEQDFEDEAATDETQYYSSGEESSQETQQVEQEQESKPQETDTTNATEGYLNIRIPYEGGIVRVEKADGTCKELYVENEKPYERDTVSGEVNEVVSEGMGYTFKLTGTVGEVLKVTTICNSGYKSYAYRLLRDSGEIVSQVRERDGFAFTGEYSQDISIPSENQTLEVYFADEKYYTSDPAIIAREEFGEANVINSTNYESVDVDSAVSTNVDSDAGDLLKMSLFSAVRASSSSGAPVTLSKGKEVFYHAYGTTYSTSMYNMTTQDGVTHLGYCAQASLKNPAEGTYTIWKLSPASSSDYMAIKFVLATVDGGPMQDVPTSWNMTGLNAGMGSLIGSSPADYNSDYAFSLTHQLISYLFTGSTYPWASGNTAANAIISAGNWARSNWNNADWGTRLQSYEVYCATTGSDTQVIMWLDGAERGKISVQKVSGNDTLTSGNSNYSLQNAVYGVYDTFGNHITSITTNDTGYSESDWLNPGGYFVQEIQAPKGYQIDNTRYPVTVTPGNVARVQMNGGDNHIEPPKTGRINLYKVSANPDCTNGNPNYSYKDATYTIYTGIRKGTNGQSIPFNAVGTITTDINGFGTKGDLPLGRYYVKETKSSPGYDLDTNIYTVDINDVFGVNEIQVAVTSQEPPKLDPVSFALKKVDADTGNVPVGSGSMEDAHYELKFYGDIMSTDPALSGKTPLRTWVLKTTAIPDGAILIIEDASKISGDAFWYDNGGRISFPYGTLTIHEIKSPNGYLLNDETIVVPVTGDDISIDPQYHEPIQREVALRLNLYKYQSGTNYPVKGATFVHTKPDGSTETLTTDENGFLSFKGLQWGNHKVVETAIIDGLEVNRNPITFNVSERNKITITSSATETDTDGNIILKVEDDGNITAIVYDKPSPFDLHISKINNHDLKLKGAEFTLYSDAECKNPIARKVSNTNGDLTFEDLIPQRNYYLKETKAPVGYRIPVNDDGSDIVWQINVASFPTEGVFTFYVNNVPYTTTSSGSYTVSGTVKDRVCNMTIVNPIGSKLPVTGSNATLIILGAGLALIGVSVFLRKKSKLL